jgi:endonuclease III
MVAAAMGRLKEGMEDRGGLSIEGVRSSTEDEVRSFIYGVGFHNNKAKYIKRSAELIRDEFQSRVPSTFHELCSLPGVGPKMAM